MAMLVVSRHTVWLVPFIVKEKISSPGFGSRKAREAVPPWGRAERNNILLGKQIPYTRSIEMARGVHFVYAFI